MSDASGVAGSQPRCGQCDHAVGAITYELQDGDAVLRLCPECFDRLHPPREGEPDKP